MKSYNAKWGVLRMGANNFYNLDCLLGMEQLIDNSVDMILCDLPYGVTDNEWDIVIPMDDLLRAYRRICKQKANVVLFCQQPFTTTIMSSIYKSEFSHSLVWIKNTKTRAKASKRVPLSQFEEIVVLRINKYANKGKHTELREYFSGELAKSGLSAKQLEYLIKNKAAHHYFRFSSDFRIPTEENYKKMQSVTGRFSAPYAWVKELFDKEKDNLCVYNQPQDNTNLIFCNSVHSGERMHPSQKPVPLMERLLLTYSNPGDTVLDNCAGSGTTGIACINTGRNYILMEKDEDIYKSAIERISAHQSLRASQPAII